MTALNRFLATLARSSVGPGVSNPWTGWTPGVDDDVNAPRIRCGHLKAYLSARIDRAELVLVAEAVGYQGARFSGIPMTSERILLGYTPGVPPNAVFKGFKRRTSAETAARNATERQRGFCEPTATVVWTTLLGLGLEADRFVLWNSFAFHPHRPGAPLTNRTPTNHEFRRQAVLLTQFLALFPGRRVVAVGKQAHRRLSTLGMNIPAVRHPSKGGATEFRRGIKKAL